MRKVSILLTYCLILLPGLSLFGLTPIEMTSYSGFPGQHDSIEKQILYNGRAWRNLYYSIHGDQFLFSEEFLPGTVTINNRLYNGLMLKYDICNDEIMTINKLGIIIQLNKEMINMFTLNSGVKTFLFQRLDTTSTAPFSGYVNVLYDGNVSLLVRYRKEILQNSGDEVYYKFNQLQKIYLLKDRIFYPVSNKKDLLNNMTDKRQLVRNYMKSNRIKISKKDPSSFVPVVKYYNSLLP
jgi:hypothetical protein